MASSPGYDDLDRQIRFQRAIFRQTYSHTPNSDSCVNFLNLMGELYFQKGENRQQSSQALSCSELIVVCQQAIREGLSGWQRNLIGDLELRWQKHFLSAPIAFQVDEVRVWKSFTEFYVSGLVELDGEAARKFLEEEFLRTRDEEVRRIMAQETDYQSQHNRNSLRFSFGKQPNNVIDATKKLDEVAQKAAERLAMEESDRKAKTAEAERLAREKADRKAKAEEVERLAKEEAERQAKMDTERKAKEDIDRKAIAVEAERLAKEEAERKAKAAAEAEKQQSPNMSSLRERLSFANNYTEAAKKLYDDAAKEKKAQEERLAKEEAYRKANATEAERLANEAKMLARAEAERKAKAAKAEAERLAREVERLAREEAERKARAVEAERLAMTEADRIAKAEEAEMLAKEEADRQAKAAEAERLAKEETERNQRLLERINTRKANIPEEAARKVYEDAANKVVAVEEARARALAKREAAKKPISEPGWEHCTRPAGSPSKRREHKAFMI